jgi:hypothetical protein
LLTSLLKCVQEKLPRTMCNTLSALDHRPSDFIREVSPEAVGFYVDDLSGISLPETFKTEHADNIDVRFWKPEDRLQGKFGRWAVTRVEDDKEIPLDDILLMGSTIGLTGFDRYGDLQSLRHVMLLTAVRGVLKNRGLTDEPLGVKAIDYGSTAIHVEDGEATKLTVGGSSVDFGRADKDVRQRTCEAFGSLLGNHIEVVNLNPEPKDYERIIR